jgi:amidase
VDADDQLVARLRAAGCVVIGKTQMPELAIWPFTEPAAFAATRNPWRLDRTTGGSTGGGGAAVAAGMAAIALGSDGGGSIRIPAACCGTFGVKPGPGVVPVAGGVSEHWLGLTAFGPLARTVADAALALDILAGTTGYRDSSPADASAAHRRVHPAPTGRRQGQPASKGGCRRDRGRPARRRALGRDGVTVLPAHARAAL